MKTGKRIVAVIAMVCFLISAIIPVYADEIEDSQQKLQDVSRQIQQQKDNIYQASVKEDSIMGQIQSLEQNISATEQEISTMCNRISVLEEDISQTEAEIAASEDELQGQIDYLSDRLVYMYEDGMDVSYMEVLFAAENIRDFLTRYDLLQYIVEQDMDVIESINKHKRDLDIKKSDFEVQKKEFVAIKETQERKQKELSVQRSKKQVMFDNVRQEKDSYEDALEELERTSRELEELIRRAQSGDQIGTGIYTWPTPSCHIISSPYAMRFHPILKTYKMHTGIDIAASMGADIVAADTGKVIYADWSGGYGQVIIIDHGGGMSTLYAHQSRFVVSPGETVVKGQVIGKIGTTGWSTGPHLHFEVRINGNHTNPLDYVS